MSMPEHVMHRMLCTKARLPGCLCNNRCALKRCPCHFTAVTVGGMVWVDVQCK